MIDISKLKYCVIVMDGSGREYDISNYIQNLGWEENENEISVRSSFTSRNDKTSKGYLSRIIKPGCLVSIFASAGKSLDGEVARGYVETWNPEEKNSGNNLTFTCYDELYKLQKSQDNRYYPSGTGTKSAIQSIFKDWGIHLKDYKGPDATHGKLVYKNKYLSDIILELLDDAHKKGQKKSIIRAVKGYVTITARGSNKDVYVFDADNTQSFSTSISTANLITRVKIVGQSKQGGKGKVYATLNGKTEYGIRQRIYTRSSDESLSDAKSAAQEILKDEGRINKEMRVQSPDIPFIRKGDLVYIKSTFATAYYYVKSIRHSADTCSMTMELELSNSKDTSDSNNGKDEEFKVGDTVNFHGGTHYVSSFKGAKGYKARAGKAKITIKDGSGKSHPWHLIHLDSSSNVYGWVDDGTFD